MQSQQGGACLPSGLPSAHHPAPVSTSPCRPLRLPASRRRHHPLGHHLTRLQHHPCHLQHLPLPPSPSPCFPAPPPPPGAPPHSPPTPSTSPVSSPPHVIALRLPASFPVPPPPPGAPPHSPPTPSTSPVRSPSTCDRYVLPLTLRALPLSPFLFSPAPTIIYTAFLIPFPLFFIPLLSPPPSLCACLSSSCPSPPRSASSYLSPRLRTSPFSSPFPPDAPSATASIIATTISVTTVTATALSALYSISSSALTTRGLLPPMHGRLPLSPSRNLL
ncbi:unnamed protein product, partial [Closterium sp. NIES-54]